MPSVPSTYWHSLAAFHMDVTTLEDLERTTRRMLGGEHPFTLNTEGNLRNARAALRARETGKKVIVTYK